MHKRSVKLQCVARSPFLFDFQMVVRIQITPMLNNIHTSRNNRIKKQYRAVRKSTTLPKMARQNKACTGIHWKRYGTQKETCMLSASKVEIFYIDAYCRGTISARFPRYSVCCTEIHVRNRRQRNDSSWKLRVAF